MLFTRWGVWGFNEAKHLSLKLMDLPLEESCSSLLSPFAVFHLRKCLCLRCKVKRKTLNEHHVVTNLHRNGLISIGIAHWGDCIPHAFTCSGVLWVLVTRAHWLPAYIAYLLATYHLSLLMAF